MLSKDWPSSFLAAIIYFHIVICSLTWQSNVTVTNRPGVQLRAVWLVKLRWVSGSEPPLRIFCSQTASLTDCFRLLNAKWCSLGYPLKVLLDLCVGCLVISTFFIYFRWPFDSRAKIALGQTELGLNVWGGVGGRTSFVARALSELLWNSTVSNPRSLQWSAGQQAAANEALQGRCGDRFLSSLKQKSLPLLPHLYSTTIHLRWILISGGIWMA